MVKRADLVQIGRVVLINYGPYVSKLAVILDVVDGARALVDGPESRTGVPRHTIPLRNLSLTPQVIPVGRASRPAGLEKVFDEAKVKEVFGASGWGKKLTLQAKRASLTDFDRFKVMGLKKKRSQVLRKEYLKLKKSTIKKARK